MEEKKDMLVAGDIMREMEEINKLIAYDEQTVVYSTQTATCMTFFTIICC